MKTLILYATKYGCTEKCAKVLAQKLDGKVDVHNVKLASNVDLSQYDKVIMGGSIYIGKIRKEIKEFALENLKALKDKKIALFICCMREGEEAENEIKASFPQELIENAVAKEYFGGEFLFDKMSFLDGLIAKKVAKVSEDLSNISEEKIDDFARKIRNA